MALIGDVLARIRSDVSQFQAGLDQVNARLDHLKPVATSAGHGVGEVKRSLTALGVEAAGVNPHIARLTQGLLAMGTGTGVVVGITAGAAAIAGAWEVATHAAKVLDEQNKKLHDGFIAAAQGSNVAARAALDQASAQLALIQTQLQAMELIANSARAIGSPTASVAEANVIRMRANVATLTNTVNALRQGWLAAKQQITDTANRAAERDLPRITKSMDDLVRKFAELKTALPTITKPLEDLVKKFMQLQDVVQRLDQSMIDMLKKVGDKTAEAANKIGTEIGGALMTGIINAIRSGTDPLKAILDTVLTLIINVFSKSLLGGIFGGIAKPFASKAAGLDLPAIHPQLVQNISVGASGNPIAAARDADWQRALRESMLVAEQNGFRFARIGA